MTVTYTAEVANSSFGCFLKLLFRWRGSIYKLLWKELLIFLGLYYLLNFVYRWALTPDQRVIFERISLYCDSFNSLIPVAFVLGFYVSIVCTRWWDQFNSIPWPDRTALFVTALIHGHDERPRLMRRTIMRYLVLSFTMTLSSISISVKKRFPSLSHMKDAGLMSECEQTIIENLSKRSKHSLYFVPLVWATSLVSRARKEGMIKDDFAVKTIIDEINSFRGSLGGLFNYDWVNIPMVYTQVVTLAVYTFFLSCIMGRQFLDPQKGYENHRADMYIPVFTLLQFFFYLGWLKVAESMINPFGEDDDDFDINSTIDRNIQVSYLIVDEMHSEFPELIKDQYWDETDFNLPWTEAAEKYKNEPYLGSAVDITINAKQMNFMPMSSIREDYPLVDRGRTTDAVNLPEMAYHHVPSYDHPRSHRNSRRGFLDHFLKRSTSRGSRNSIRSPSTAIADSNDLIPEGSFISMATSSNVQTPTPTSLPPGEDEIFEMSDLDGVEDDTSLFSSNPFRDALLRRMIPNKSEPPGNNHQKKVKDRLTSSTSSDKTIRASGENLAKHNHNQNLPNEKDSPGDKDPKDKLIANESEKSKRVKGFPGKPAKLIIKSASEHEVENNAPRVSLSESLPARV